MLDEPIQSTEIPVTHCFSADVSAQIREGHRRIHAASSSLLHVRSILSALTREQITLFNLVRTPGMIQEQYVLDHELYRVDVDVRACSPARPLERMVRDPSSPLAINQLLRSMQKQWGQRKCDDLEAEFLLVNDLVMKLFVNCSKSSIYEIVSDDGYWSIFFHDRRGNTQAELVIQQK